MAENTPNPEFMEAREGVATGEHHEITPEEMKARKRRNIAIALGVVAFIVLVYSTTLLRLTQNIEANRDAETIGQLEMTIGIS